MTLDFQPGSITQESDNLAFKEIPATTISKVETRTQAIVNTVTFPDMKVKIVGNCPVLLKKTT